MFELQWSHCFSHFFTHANFTPSVFLESKTQQSPTYWPASLHAYTAPTSHTHFYSITHIHIPINVFSSQGGVSIPWCTVMEPPGGLWLAWITKHPLEVDASLLLSSLTGRLRCWDSFSSCFFLMRKTVYAGNVRFKGNKVNLFSNTLLTSAFI